MKTTNGAVHVFNASHSDGDLFIVYPDHFGNYSASEIEAVVEKVSKNFSGVRFEIRCGVTGVGSGYSGNDGDLGGDIDRAFDSILRTTGEKDES